MDTKAVSVFLAGIAAGAAIALAATSSRRSSHGRHGSGDTGKASETSATASTRKSSAKSQQTQMIAASSAGAKPKAGNPLNADTSAGGRLSKRPRKSSHNTDQNFFPFEFPPIGTIRSCFRECRGTPRQGSFAPSTRGFLEFQKRVPANSTDGLEAFSHVWILFIFHTNTNLHHSKRAHNGGGSHSFRSKIKPPKLKGKSIGVFASRTPHRPNAIGITLAKIERVDGRRIDLSALDLLDGTPVLDIKPYVTPYDSIPAAQIPTWCGSLPPGAISSKSELKDLSSIVHFAPGVVDIISKAASNGKLRFYDSGDDVCQTIRELLASDVRPEQAYRKWKAKASDASKGARLCRFRFDMLLISFIRMPEKGVVAKVMAATIEDEETDRLMRDGNKKRYSENL